MTGQRPRAPFGWRDAPFLADVAAFAVQVDEHLLLRLILEDRSLDPLQAGRPPAFILTKLLSDITAALVFIIAIPGLIFLVEVNLATRQMVPQATFLAGTGVFLLTLIFYISMVILLGVLFEARGSVLGTAFGIMLGGMMIANFVPQISYILPVTMDGIPKVLMLGLPMPGLFVSEVIATAIFDYFRIAPVNLLLNVHHRNAAHQCSRGETAAFTSTAAGLNGCER